MSFPFPPGARGIVLEHDPACVEIVPDLIGTSIGNDFYPTQQDLLFALADAMHARPDLKDIPIVFVTASLQRDQVERYYAHGATTYMAKPFSTAQLREQVDKMLGVKG